MSVIKYRTNPIPPKCKWGRKLHDEISGQVVYEDLLTANDDGQFVNTRNRRTLDDRPDLDGPNIVVKD